MLCSSPPAAARLWFLWFLCALLLLRGGAVGEEAKKVLLSTRTTYFVVGMVPFGDFVSTYGPALKDHLDKVVGVQFEPRVSFEIRQDRAQAAYDLSPFDDVIANKRDFVLTTPNIAACLQSEFLFKPLLTQRVLRGGRSLNHYGGVIYTLKTRNDINSVSDLAGKKITASDFNLCQFQWDVIDASGISMIADPAQLRFNPAGNKAIVDEVLAGTTDVGFARTDTLELYDVQEDRDKIKVVGELKGVMLEGQPFPFKTTSPIYPENTLMVGEHVEWQLQAAVTQALLALPSNSSESKKAKVEAFQPALSYGPVRDLMVRIGTMTHDEKTRRWRCARGAELYESILCPVGTFKKTKVAVENGCIAAMSFSCYRMCSLTIECVLLLCALCRCIAAGLPCPDGAQCLCSPCKRAKALELTATVEEQEGKSFTCSKMQVCGSVERHIKLPVLLLDSMPKPRTPDPKP